MVVIYRLPVQCYFLFQIHYFIGGILPSIAYWHFFVIFFRPKSTDSMDSLDSSESGYNGEGTIFLGKKQRDASATHV